MTMIKRYILTVCTIAAGTITPFFSAPAQAEPVPAAESYVCRTTSVLNLRATPDGQVIDQLEPGTRVWKVAPAVGSWQPIATVDARGYVWGDYVCNSTEFEAWANTQGNSPSPMPNRTLIPRAVTPARCGEGDNVRNIDHPGGIQVLDAPATDANVVGSVSDGAAVRIVPDAVTTLADGSIWLPIEFPLDGYFQAGQGEVVDRVVYCTRFY